MNMHNGDYSGARVQEPNARVVVNHLMVGKHTQRDATCECRNLVHITIASRNVKYNLGEERKIKEKRGKEQGHDVEFQKLKGGLKKLIMHTLRKLSQHGALKCIHNTR
jgi:hypothetical protein